MLHYFLKNLLHLSAHNNIAHITSSGTGTNRMHLINHKSSSSSMVILIMLLLTHLSNSAPTTNQTSPSINPILTISPTNLADDTCPTPPTEFLPYSPPSGYTPTPGCPATSQGPQPSEGNPPAGYSGSSRSGQGSGTTFAATSGAMGLRRVNLVGRFMGRFMGGRRSRMVPRSSRRSISSIASADIHGMGVLD